MLALSRKTGQNIIIGGNIKVTVLEIRGDTVRLGFHAPDHIVIDREEVAIARASGAPPEKIPPLRYDPDSGTFGPPPPGTKAARTAEKWREIQRKTDWRNEGGTGQ